MRSNPDTVSAYDYVSHLRFAKGRGARCWTADGREFIDLICGQGPVVLGHGHPAVTAAVSRQLAIGSMLPGPGPALFALRERLFRRYSHATELLTFKTGSEAVAAAMRLARAYTSRQRVLRVGFHGWHDQFVSPYVRCHSYDPTTFAESWPRGVPHDCYSQIVSAWNGSDPNDLVELVRNFGSELAAVIIDPVQLPFQSAKSVATDLALACRDNGALLIYDESKTGLRLHASGFQGLYGLSADLTILSKALANGLPLAVVLGGSEIMSLAASIRIKGTFGSETASIAAAVTTMDTLEDEDAPTRLAERGSQLIAGLNGAIRAAGLTEVIKALGYQWPCLPYIHFSGDAKGLEDTFHGGLVEHGVLMLRDHMSYVCLALTEQEVDRVVEAAAAVLRRLT